jgi:YD repeat-containing protein
MTIDLKLACISTLDIPYIQTTTLIGDGPGSIGTAGPWGEIPRRECSGVLEDSEVFVAGNPYSSTDFYNGDTIHIPGQISEKLLDKADSQFRKRTKSNWGVKCENNATNTGEIFKVHSPDGTVYTFSRRFQMLDGMVVNNKAGLANVTGNSPKDDTVASATTSDEDTLSVIQYESANRYHKYMFVTLVEDRFGDTVTYDYTDGGLLTSITGSDGRKIEIIRFTELVLDR